MKYNEFRILVFLERNKGVKYTQRDISKNLRLSLGTTNKIIDDLKKFGYIDANLSLTDDGLKALEPYRVKRAIFFAAGFGSRLRPITLNTPKPLVKVNGKRIIETLLDACVKSEIDEIYIVRGYLKDEFDLLLKKYPNIKFIDNDVYNSTNNISSAYAAKDYLENTYVLESDLYLKDESLIQKYEYGSNYLGKYVDKTDDWCLETKNNRISKFKHGGTNCYNLYGIFYVSKEDGKLLQRDLEDYYLNVPGAKESFYDEVALDHYKNNYNIFVRDCYEGDIVEIDSFEELKQIDNSYDV